MDGTRSALTYCAVCRLGFIPVMGCEMMESVEYILVGDISQAGWRVGPGDESGSGGGHGWIGDWGENEKRRR